MLPGATRLPALAVPRYLAVPQDVGVRILLAPDGFGGTLGPMAAAQAMATGWRSAAPADALDLAPLSDGGPGFLEVLAAALPSAVRHQVVVEDPLARPVSGSWLQDGDTAYVEAAQACGLHLLTGGERDVRRATSYGVGQLVLAALDVGVRRIVVGLGGSATNDGGAGALAALGLARLGPDGVRLAPGGAALRGLLRLEGRPDRRLAETELVVATDVDSPLLGLRGASAVFGPQKGASREDVAALDLALEVWAETLERHLAVGVRELPGAGAAGGLGAALLAVGGVRRSGIGLVQELVGLGARADAADLIVTGEGTLDATSLSGKVLTGVVSAAAEAAVPCVVIAGEVRAGRRELAAAGIDSAWSLVEQVGPERAMGDAAGALAEVAARVARQWSPQRSR